MRNCFLLSFWGFWIQWNPLPASGPWWLLGLYENPLPHVILSGMAGQYSPCFMCSESYSSTFPTPQACLAKVISPGHLLLCQFDSWMEFQRVFRPMWVEEVTEGSFPSWASRSSIYKTMRKDHNIKDLICLLILKECFFFSPWVVLEKPFLLSQLGICQAQEGMGTCQTAARIFWGKESHPVTWSTVRRTKEKFSRESLAGCP